MWIDVAEIVALYESLCSKADTKEDYYVILKPKGLKHKITVFQTFFGDPGGARTLNKLLKRQLLCH